MTTAGVLAKWISWPAGANIDCSSWASHEVTRTCVGLQILLGNVRLTSRVPEGCACAALYSPKDVKMLYTLNL